MFILQTGDQGPKRAADLPKGRQAAERNQQVDRWVLFLPGTTAFYTPRAGTTAGKK